jgi:outer membrane immunogenic protein
MKVRIQGMLATAAGAALFASAGIALADGMPGGGGYRPALWSGVYVGGESGWEWERGRGDYAPAATSSNFHRDGVTVGLFLGYQHQFGNLVVGVEGDFIGNEFDTRDSQGRAPIGGNGSCPNPAFNCTNRITNLITIGPRVGWSFGNWLPYATGGFATGSTNFRAIPASGVTSDQADMRHDGWYIGGGLDWKLARNVVVGLEYRHTDLGHASAADFNPATGLPTGVIVTTRQESDSVMVRGSLLFGGRDYAPLK